MSALFAANITVGDRHISPREIHCPTLLLGFNAAIFVQSLGTAPIARSHAGLVALNRNRATALGEARQNWRVISPAYRAIPLMPRAEGGAFHRAKDMNREDAAAPLRPPARAPRASAPRI